MNHQEKVSLGRLVGMTMKALKDTLCKNFVEAACPITAEQFIILKIISFHENVNQQECADMLRIDKSLLLRKINILQKEKLVIRYQDEQDKRKNQLVLTKKGSEILQDCEVIEEKTMKQLTSGVSEHDFKIFANVLTTIRENALKSDYN